MDANRLSHRLSLLVPTIPSPGTVAILLTQVGVTSPAPVPRVIATEFAKGSRPTVS